MKHNLSMPIVRGVERVRGNSISKGYFSGEVAYINSMLTNYGVAQLDC